MLRIVPPEIQEAMDMGISIYAGEAEEGRLDEVILDAWNGTLKRLYNYMDDLPGIENAPTPHLPAAALARNEGKKSSFDLGRGCPFQCSFCTIINVQGRKSRFRNADDLEAIVRENYKQGITAFFITDDNMARKPLTALLKKIQKVDQSIKKQYAKAARIAEERKKERKRI